MRPVRIPSSGQPLPRVGPASAWPELRYENWRDTATTLHLWTQVVGKVRYGLTPWLNHSWHVPFYVSACGLDTSVIPVGDEALQMEFDFVRHRLAMRTSRGDERFVPLGPQTVAEFYRECLAALNEMGISVAIYDMPSEMVGAIRFREDGQHATYDPDAAHRFWRVLLQADRVLKLFRTGFLGKSSPVHFFWGEFDLAVTRFSGRPAPRHPGGMVGLPDAVTIEGYSHEVSSAGFWPGNDEHPTPMFYSYAYPQPARFPNQPVTPGASFDPALGEFVLPYELVCSSSQPDEFVLDFLQSTYAAAADTGNWDRKALDCPMGIPRLVRPV